MDLANVTNFSFRSCNDLSLRFVDFIQILQLQSTCWLLNGGNCLLTNENQSENDVQALVPF